MKYKEKFLELNILNYNYLGMHGIGSKSFALSNGSSGSLLETDTLESFVQVQSVISGGISQLFLSRFFNHPTTKSIN